MKFLLDWVTPLTKWGQIANGVLQKYGKCKKFNTFQFVSLLISGRKFFITLSKKFTVLDDI